MDTLDISYLNNVFWTAFFIGFGLYFTCILFLALIQVFKDTLKNSI